jgi:lysophospholipase L1-like esterase
MADRADAAPARSTAARWGRAALRGIPTFVGWVVIVAALDLAIGAAAGRGDPPPPPPDLLLPGPTDELAENREVDPRVDVAAYADSPWNEEYWAQFRSLEFSYTPFLFATQDDSDLSYIQVRDGVRLSYQQEDLPADAPVVWFFGGSTMWGEGQRDLYTIPSQVARLAEDQGVALRVVNYGQRGWVHWQELFAFERALAEADPPDLVVFYDGVNDINVMNPGLGGQLSEDPSVFRTASEIPDPVPPPLSAPDQGGAAPLLDRILERSLLLRLAGHLGLDSPASAGEGADTGQIAALTLQVYERGRAISASLADGAGADPLFFWQPQFANGVDGPPAEVLAGLTDPTIDITGALDGVPAEDVYIDGAHTNELGTQLVAEAMLPYLVDALSAPS